jgi:hypothetical protein
MQEGYNFAVMHIGAPACGMNAAVRSFVRNCIYRGDTALGINDGIEGLLAGNVSAVIVSSVKLLLECNSVMYNSCLRNSFFSCSLKVCHYHHKSPPINRIVSHFISFATWDLEFMVFLPNILMSLFNC